MKKSGPALIVHVVLTIAMILCSIGATVNFIVGASNAVTGAEQLKNLMNVLLMLVILAMLIMGALHLLKDYSKQAAKYFKAFLLLHIVVCALTIFIDLFFSAINTFLLFVTIRNACKAVILLALLFWRDLGKRKSWILCGVLFALDIAALAFALIHMANVGFDFSIMGYITALVADGTTGLAIRGKYKDKEARGSK